MISNIKHARLTSERGWVVQT